MNGRWIDQFPPEREYDLEIDEDTYELQMADAAAAQAAANSAAESARRAEEVVQGLREEIPTKVSELENDSNYAVDANYVHTDNNFTSSEKNKLEGIAAGAEVNVNADWNAISGDALILNKPTKVSDFDNDVGYLTEHQDISGKANAADLAAIATSGSYNDLLNKPSIPSKVSDLIDDSGHYTKPTNGIPASDLEETYLTEHQDISGKADRSEIPTAVSQLDNDAGYITGYTETDPTVPSWAKASTKPSYTASEVGAPTVQEMNTAINNAIGSVNSFDVAVVQALPSENIGTHTIYLVPKTGETNDVYDEYIYINNAWEMVGNTQIDLSDYATKSEIPDVPVEDVQINGTSIINNGIANIPIASEANLGLVKAKAYIPGGVNNGSVYLFNDTLYTIGADKARIKTGADLAAVIASANQHQAVFYGLAKAAGADEKNSTLPDGQYTDEAKAAIQQMLDVPATTDLSTKIDKESFNNAGIFNKTFVVIDNGEFTATTVKDSREQCFQVITTNNLSLSPYKYYKITFDNVEYELYSQIIVAEQTWAEPFFVSLGNHSLLADVNKNLITKYKYTVPFCILDSGSQQLILTQTAGTHTVKIEIENRQINLIPRELLHNGMNEYYQSGTRGANFSIGFNSFGPSVSNSIGIGIVNTITAKDGVAIGRRHIVSGDNGTAVGGWKSTASGRYSFTSGMMNEAQGVSSIALGQLNIASGQASVALGWNNNASGNMSHAEGRLTIANHKSQHVFGQANIADPSTAAATELGTYVEIVGNGTADNARSNARTLDWSGNERLAGDLTIHAGGANETTVGEALTDTQAMLATVETTTTASKAYTVDDLLIYDGQLYKVINAISLGDTIIPDGNVEATTVEQELSIANNDVTDVQINGTSIVQGGVASIPVRSNIVSGSNELVTSNAIYNTLIGFTSTSLSQIKGGSTTVRLISPSNQHQATFYGLAKIAGHDEKDSTLPVGQYTDAAKSAIQSMLNVPDKTDITVEDVQINGTSVINDGIANIPVATDNGGYGLVKINSSDGVRITSDGTLAMTQASNNDYKNATTNYKSVTPYNQHQSTFYGLAKAAGDTTQSASSNAVGTYTDNAKAAIQYMLNVPDKSDIDSKAPSIYKAIGPTAIATFDDGADDMPLKSLVVDIEPVQNLHGYDHPWAAGYGVNLLQQICNNSDFTIDENGAYSQKTAGAPWLWLYNKNVVNATIQPGTYTISFYAVTIATDRSAEIRVVDSTDKQLKTVYGRNKQSGYATFTVDAETTIGIDIKCYDGSWKLQLEEGSAASDWTPYENICPMIGNTGIDISVSGADTTTPAVTHIAFVDPETEDSITVYGGTLTINADGSTELSALPHYASYAGETLVGPWLSSMDVYAEGATPTTGAEVVDLGGVATVYHLTAEQIRTMGGVNNIWSDAGDVTAVYPADTKSYIDEQTAAQPKTVTVTGTTPVIAALSGISYKCGEVATLDITLPTSGCIDVIFESGSTPTVLTVTPPTGVTVRWANGFDPTNIAQNTTYEINILDGLGVACTWM